MLRHPKQRPTPGRYRHSFHSAVASGTATRQLARWLRRLKEKIAEVLLRFVRFSHLAVDEIRQNFDNALRERRPVVAPAPDRHAAHAKETSCGGIAAKYDLKDEIMTAGKGSSARNATTLRNQNAMTLLNSNVVRLADPTNFCNGAVLLMMLISHIIATTHRHASGCYNQTKDRNQLTTLDQCDDPGLLGPADIGATPSHPQAKPSGTQVAPHKSWNHKHCSACSSCSS